LHNFVIKGNRNGDDAVLQRAAESMTEDHSHLTGNEEIGLTTPALDVRQKFSNYFLSPVGELKWQNNHMQ
jgi:hypothetical protein